MLFTLKTKVNIDLSHSGRACVWRSLAYLVSSPL